MKMKEKLNELILPKGICSGACCGDCIYMDLNDSNSRGEYYCGKKEKYYPAGDRICSEYNAK